MADTNDPNDSKVVPLLTEATPEGISDLLADVLPPYEKLDRFGEHLQPNKRERENYYYGLEGDPHLIARTSTNTWIPFTHGPRGREVRVKKRLCSVGPDSFPYKLAALMKDEKFLTDIANNIQCIEWYSVEAWHCNDKFPIHEHFFTDRWATNLELLGPVIFFISADPSVTPWRKAMEAALRCKEVLATYGIRHVECEVKSLPST